MSDALWVMTILATIAVWIGFLYYLGWRDNNK